ncbi:MAG: YeeE/YedE family protein [Planctomycetota bacterium]
MSTPIVGLIMGAIFGASLVLAGLTNPDKIIATLRLKDLHAMRTVAVFVLVGMLGAWLLGLAGAANLNIKPAAVVSLLIGGALFGIGLGLTGFGPGSALASAASGRIDALSTIIGMLCGAHLYVLIYRPIAVPLEKLIDYGQVTLPQMTGGPPISWIIPIVAAGSLTLLLTKGVRSGDVGSQQKAEELAMNEDFPATRGLALATDCIEVAQMFRRWKNLLFVIVMLCLLLLQGSFWLVKTGCVEIDSGASIATGAHDKPTGEVAKVAMTGPNRSSGEAAETTAKARLNLGLHVLDITFGRVSLVVRAANAVLVFASVLYALTLFCGLTVSLGGRLGGQNHISQAFYLSLIMLVLLLPWQTILGSMAPGAIFTAPELAKWCRADAGSMLDTVLLYLRFTGYWALAMAVLLLAQLRSFQWSRVILRKLVQVWPQNLPDRQ